MKKRVILAITAVLTAVLFMAACSKDNNNRNRDDDDDDDIIETAIEIDGKFTDWDALSPNDVKTFTYDAVDGPYPAMKKLVVYQEELFFYAYMEIDYSKVEGNGDHWTPVHFYFDTDGTTIGYGGEAWAPNNHFNYMLEGNIESSAGVASFEPDAYKWITEDAGWDDAELLFGTGFSSGDGVIGTDGIFRYELKLIPELMPFKLSGDVKVLIDVHYNWNPIGLLPADSNGIGLPTTFKF